MIWESLQALKENQLLTLKNLYGISVRTIFYFARRMMELLGMAEILGKLKKEKHKLLWQRSRAMAIKHNFSAILTEQKNNFPADLSQHWEKLPHKKIGLNGLLIHDYPTGLSRYSYELIHRIMTQLRGRSIAYSASPELSLEFPESTTGTVPPFHYPANFRSNSIRLSWEQVGLRYACFKDKLDLLYSPIAEGLLFPKLPQIITIHDLLPFHYPSLLPRWVPYYEYFLPSIIKGSNAVV